MTWLSDLMRPDLRDFAAYRSARSEAASPASIEIDANESPWPPFGRPAAEDAYHRYPEPQPAALRARLAQIYGVPADCLLLGRGSDEGIDLLLRLFCRAGVDEILICPPTFGMYEVAARIQGARTLKVPLRADFQLDVPAILAACTANTKLIFIPSPNAPMGHLMAEADLRALCAARRDSSLVVADEAYVEFTGDPSGVIPLLASTPNLVILRTLSKAHALAGERVGCVIAAPEIVAALGKIIAPYPLTRSSIRAAEDALSASGYRQGEERRRTLVAERARMSAALATSPLVAQVYPSAANFILVTAADPAAVHARLARAGIRARDRSADLPGAIRLSIGTPQENDAVLAALGCDVPKSEAPSRVFSVRRRTKETAIDVTVLLDRPGVLDIATGIGFFDHMLMQLGSHGGFGLSLHCAGDLHIDQHHTIEDCALALGAALSGALGDKSGIARFGFTAPLDEALAQVAVDLSGRPYFVFTGAFPAESVGGLSSEMVPHFFRSLATSLGAAIHLTVTGENTHHMIEAGFKAVGRALRQALRREGDAIPSTKGTL
jgi:histidinol-phosphate aminotransferase/imidazoleglycerol-phosphate dehydratase/histidinol-phosphatase